MVLKAYIKSISDICQRPDPRPRTDKIKVKKYSILIYYKNTIRFKGIVLTIMLFQTRKIFVHLQNTDENLFDEI